MPPGMPTTFRYPGPRSCGSCTVIAGADPVFLVCMVHCCLCCSVCHPVCLTNNEQQLISEIFEEPVLAVRNVYTTGAGNILFNPRLQAQGTTEQWSGPATLLTVQRASEFEIQGAMWAHQADHAHWSLLELFEVRLSEHAEFFLCIAGINAHLYDLSMPLSFIQCIRLIVVVADVLGVLFSPRISNNSGCRAHFPPQLHLSVHKVFLTPPETPIAEINWSYLRKRWLCR
jgi:hypothetical protein